MYDFKNQTSQEEKQKRWVPKKIQNQTGRLNGTTHGSARPRQTLSCSPDKNKSVVASCGPQCHVRRSPFFPSGNSQALCKPLQDPVLIRLAPRQFHLRAPVAATIRANGLSWLSCSRDLDGSYVIACLVSIFEHFLAREMICGHCSRWGPLSSSADISPFMFKIMWKQGHISKRCGWWKHCWTFNNVNSV